MALTGFGQAGFNFIVNLGNSRFDAKNNCTYIVHFQNNEIRKMNFVQLKESYHSEASFCGPVRIIEIEPWSYQKGLYKTKNVVCENLATSGPIKLESKYRQSRERSLNANHSHSFDGFNPAEMDSIELFEVPRECKDAFNSLQKLTDSIAVNHLGSIKLKENLSFSAAAVPTLAEYRMVVPGTDSIHCRLLFNPGKLNELCKDPWVMTGVLLHEFGHLVGQHGINLEGDSFSDELDADNFAGHHLYDFKADTAQALRMLTLVNDTIENPFYPAKQRRREMILRGWGTRDSAVKAGIRNNYEKSMATIAGLSLTLDTLDRLFAHSLIQPATLKSRMEVTGTAIESIRCAECTDDLTLLKGKYFFSSGKFSGNLTTFSKAADCYGRLTERGLRYEYECGEAYFNARAFDLTLAMLLKSDTASFDRAKRADLNFMKGISCLKKQAPEPEAALNYLTCAINLGIPDAAAYLNRAEIKEEIYPEDSVVSVINDYYCAVDSGIDSLKLKKVNKKTAELSEKAYKRALSEKKDRPGLSAATLGYLAGKPYRLNNPYVYSHISDCFMILYDDRKEPAHLDSVIRYATLAIGRDTNDFRARLLRGKAYYCKSDASDFKSWSVKALEDLQRIPQNEKDLYSESSYYLIRILLRNDNSDGRYCTILNTYRSISRDLWKNQVLPLICQDFDKFKDRDCMTFKEKRSLKRSCEP